jgi:zinc D-Ala-D-Ala dipeptidase
MNSDYSHQNYVPLRQFFMLASIIISVGVSGDIKEATEQQRPEDFVRLERFIPGIEMDLKYTSRSNFTGTVVRGYDKGQCWITRDAAEALRKVQSDLVEMGLSLLVFDAYRPQHAVNYFVEWAKDGDPSASTQSIFFPELDKSELFPKGFIAAKSGHTRGSTVDLSICAQNADGQRKELDMGTIFDFFGEEASTTFPRLNAQQKANRLLLKTLMEKHGFKHYPVEWWHFTLKNEPYPSTYFDFVISKGHD